MRSLVILIALVGASISPLSAQDLVYYFPHVADGIAGNLAMATEFAITSPTGYPQVKVTLNCYSDDGAPWVVDLYSVDRPDAGGFKSSTTFTLAPSETVHFVTRATPSLASGWAILMTSHPVVASVSFQSVRTDVTPARVQWVAGVLPTPAGKLYDHSQNELVPEYSVNWANQAMISYRFESAGTYYIVRQDMQTYRMLVAVNRSVSP